MEQQAKPTLKVYLAVVMVVLLLTLTPHVAWADVVRQLQTTATLGSNGTSLTINVPTGAVAGDLLLAAIATDGNQTINAPAGWTLIDRGQAPGTPAQASLAVFYRVAGGSEPASYAFTWGTAEQAAGAMLRYSGVDTTNPINVSGNNTGTSTTPTAPSVTTTVNKAMIVRIYGADDDDLALSPYPSGHIGRLNIGSNFGAADTCSLGVADTTQATAGATGTAAFTLAASEEWRAVTVALRPAAPPAGTINGAVFRDFDADGTRDTREPGLSGITVTAYNASGTAVASATTDSNGNYSLTGLTDGTQYRLEVTGLPDYLRPGLTGADCRTTVMFGTSPNSNFDVGAASPADYCQSNPNLATTIFIKGDNTLSTQATAVRYPYSTSGVATKTTLAIANQIGTVYGLAYQRSSDSLFGSAYVKRGAGLGPANSTGAIYRMSGTTVTLFLDLNATGVISAGPNPHPNGMSASWVNDTGTFAAVGKVGLGDLDISEDELTLYTVNLYHKELLAIPLGSNPATPVAPSADQIIVRPVPIPASCNGNGITAPSSADVRPFGLKFYNGKVYLGMVCTTQSMVEYRDPQTFAALGTYNIRSSMRAYVYTFDPISYTFSASPILEFRLDYPRRQVNDGFPDANNDGDWLPWNDAWYPPYIPYRATPLMANPQPMLSDIEFDGEGYMMLGFRDRWADQAYDADDPGPNNWSTLIDNRHGGDVLLAYWNGSAWALESSGSAGGRLTGDPEKNNLNNGAGPGDATNGYHEFYYGEYYDRDFDPDYHRELSLGGLALLPGSGELASTLFDASAAFDNGSVIFNNDAGGANRYAQVYPAAYQFGKAGGVGDLELLCNAAPIEIGNRVWGDTDGDGIQDPGESPIANVTIELYNASGTLVVTTTTDANGNWYSRSPNVQPNTTYYVVVAAAEFQSGGDLYGYSLTNLRSSLSLRDSDAAGIAPVNLGSRVGVAYATGAAGDNDHTLDFGFKARVSLGNQVWLDQDNDGQYDAPVRVGDYVWYDLNANNLQDAGEPGVEGVRVTLYVTATGTGRALASTTTDAAGLYLFDNLPPGNYYVVFDLTTTPLGFSVVTPDAGGDTIDSDANQTTGQTAATGALSAGQQNTTLDMGLGPTSVVAVGDRAWYDVDRDGIQDAGEPGVPGVRVRLLASTAANCTGTPLATTLTDGNGYYVFVGLTPAAYRVCFDLTTIPSGYQVTTQNAGSDDSVDSDADSATGLTAATPSLTAGQVDRSLDMGIRATNATTNSLGDKVWYDKNRDGDQDGGAEPGVPGVRVALHPNGATCNDMPLAVVTTNEFGNYLFAGLPDGSYFVCFDLTTIPSGYEVTPADQGGDDTQDSDANISTGATPAVALSGGTSNLTLDMGVRLTSTTTVTVGDRAWLDADRDGIQDAGELGVPNVGVGLYQNGQSCVAGAANNGGWTTGGTQNEWEHGTPSYGITWCNSGSGCWGTDLDNTYNASSNQSLYSVVINIPVTATAPIRVTWAHAHYLAGDAGDRVRAGYSCNGGAYTYVYDVYGNAGDQAWTTVRQPNTCAAGQALQLRFRLNSDNDTTLGAGYFIDDVSVRDANANLIYSQNFDPTPAATPMLQAGTDADGYYLFDGLPTGNYFVCFDLSTLPTGYQVTTQNVGANDTIDSDASTTTGATASTGALTAGQSDMTLDMGILSTNASSASLGNYVWYDLDRDGTQDAGEAGVEGVRVTLYLTATGSSRPIATAVTNVSGAYLFAGLQPGTYYVVFDLSTLPAGYSVTTYGGNTATGSTDSDANITTGQTPPVTLAAGGSNLGLDMGLILAGNVRVGDRVWYDDDADGRQDAGESGVPGVTVYLHNAALSATCDDAPLGSATTDLEGLYLFGHLAAGNYFVCFDLDTLPTGTSVSPADTQLDDTVDSDADATGKTPPTGNLAAGKYDLTLDMGIYSTGNVSVGNYVWYDRDRDGIQDTGEGGVAGVVVELYRSTQTCNRDMPLAVTTTGSDGAYLFDKLAAGNYFVCFDLDTLPGGYEVTAQDQGGDDALDSDANTTTGATASTGALSAGQSNLTLDMGLRQTAAGTVAVGDRVWFDDDRDGVQDSGEAGVPGITVTLRTAGAGNCTTAPVLATTTDGNGLYVFSGLAAGNYFVCFDLTSLPAGTVVTGRDLGGDDSADSDADEASGQSPNTGALAAGEVDRSLDMGIFAPNHDTPLAGVTVYLFPSATSCDPNGTGAIATTTNANGKYVFTNLTPGDYYVHVPASNFASGGPLEYMSTSTGNDPAPDPDNDADKDDNGTAVTSGPCSGGVSSAPITLGVAQEPTNDENDDLNTPNVSQNTTDDLGFFEPLAVGNLVWYDLNGNGNVETGEPGVANVTVYLYRDANGNGICEPGGGDGASIASSTTDANGRYQFLNLVAGNYCVYIPSSQFGSGQALAFDYSTAPTEADPDSNVESNDNGLDGNNNPASDGVGSGVVTLVQRTEPIDDIAADQPTGYRDSSANTTADLGFAAFDLGDLPSSYNNTTFSGGPLGSGGNNGGRHLVWPAGTSGRILLGATVDVETNGQESGDASGDGGDEDGVSQAGTPWSPGIGGGRVDVVVTGGSGYLNAWIDWDSDGRFSEAGDRIFGDRAVVSGTNSLTFTIPITAPSGVGLFARFRLSDQAGEATSPAGWATDGELEDYNWPGLPTAVTLSSFTAAWGEGQVLVAWETAMEIDTVGFNLWRSESADGGYVQVNDALIPAESLGGVWGGAYSYTDSAVTQGTVYYYRLEEVEVGGARNWYGPVSTEGDRQPTAVTLRAFRARSGGGTASAGWVVAAIVVLGTGLVTLGRLQRRYR